MPDTSEKDSTRGTSEDRFEQIRSEWDDGSLVPSGNHRAHTPTMTQAAETLGAVSSDEQRNSKRLRCSIDAYGKGRTHVGRITDIGLDGCFVATNSTRAADKLGSLTFDAGRFGKVVVETEVVRASAKGAGLRFTRLTTTSARRIRRLVAELNDVEGHRHEVSSRQGKAGDGYAILDPDRIGAVFERALSSETKLTMIPVWRNERDYGFFSSRTASDLTVKSNRSLELEPGEDVFVLFTLGFDSYSFRTTVKSLEADSCKLRSPQILTFSERRSVERKKPKGAAVLSMHVPWQDEALEWKIHDMSDGGFSIRVAHGNALFLPGTPLVNATLAADGTITPLPNAVVRHVSHVREDDGCDWWKVGISRGVDRTATRVTHESVAPSKSGRLGALTDWLRDLGTKASYLYHTKVTGLRASTEDPFRVVRFRNSEGRRVVGLLNTAFPSKKRVRAPLVIVVPAFGSRKETLTAMALTITHNFRQQDRDVAVLRFDGVNNLGESEKDAGLHQQGKHTLHYTVTDGVNDILGAVKWARNNPHIDATDIILVSVSFSSVAARVALTRPECAEVDQWIVYMGAADAQNSIMNVSGNLDAWGNYVRGVPNGIVTLQGCMVDGDRFCRDIDALQAATLEDARRDIAELKLPIAWLIGKYDAWMDPKRIRDVMSIKTEGAREIVEVDSGHTPTSGDEALAQFQLITRLLWRQLFGTPLQTVAPPRGWIGAMASQEWARVRNDSELAGNEFWEGYLLGDGKVGYDLLRHLPAYQEFASLQATQANAHGARVLDLGAGTGIVTEALLQQPAQEVTCVDIVETALERISASVGGDERVKVVHADVDGTPRTALRRWINGELCGIDDLAGRIPTINRSFTRAISAKMDATLHAFLRGASLETSEVLRSCGLPNSYEPALHDLNVLSQAERGLLTLPQAAELLRQVPRTVLEGPAGLPFPDASYDAVMCSLLISYLKYPADCLSECYRVLKPGGRIVVSSMVPDADTSIIYREFIQAIETTDEDDLPVSRAELLAAARGLLNKAAELMRHEKEGLFRFYNRAELSQLVRRAGFVNASLIEAYGSPPQASIVSCKKPERPM